MFKPWQTICLAGTGLLVVGTVLLSGKGEAGSARQEPFQMPARSVLQPYVPLEALDGPDQDQLAFQPTKKKPNDSNKSTPPADAGWVGVMLEENQGKGVKVKEVFPGGPAAFAGLRVGDIVATIGDAATNSEADASAAIERLQPRQAISLTIARGKQSIKLTVKPHSHAEFKEHYVREMMRRDPRDPKFAERHGISDADIQVELVRRQFEQNQRLESKMQQLLEEVHALRAQLDASSKKN